MPDPALGALKEFDATRFVDRQAERAEFARLLQFDGDARVLAIQDDGARGKSWLIRMLEYECRWPAPRGVVSRVEVEKDMDTFQVVQRLRDDLARTSRRLLKREDAWSGFERINDRRLAQDVSLFDTPVRAASATGVAYLEGATLGGQGHTVGGRVTRIEHAESVVVTRGDWSADQDRRAQQFCVRAFLDDLDAVARQVPVILLLDAVEKRNEELGSWLVDELLPRCCEAADPPRRIFLVLAGRRLPDMRTALGPDYDRRVSSYASLGAWEDEQIRDFLKVHGFERTTPEELRYLRQLLAGGGADGRRWSLLEVLNLMQILRSGAP